MGEDITVAALETWARKLVGNYDMVGARVQRSIRMLLRQAKGHNVEDDFNLRLWANIIARMDVAVGLNTYNMTNKKTMTYNGDLLVNPTCTDQSIYATLVHELSRAIELNFGPVSSMILDS